MPTPVTVEDFMTAAPHSIGVNRTLADAHNMMNTHKIRHLPVLEGGALVGIVSQRDLHLIETLKDVNPEQVPVGDAMSMDAYVVKPKDSLDKVARRMAAKKFGSAVVMTGKKVAGIFTTTDALRALGAVLSTQKPSKKR